VSACTRGLGGAAKNVDVAIDAKESDDIPPLVVGIDMHGMGQVVLAGIGGGGNV
jgi:hypothetical protein